MVSGEKCVGYVSLADCALSAVAELGPTAGVRECEAREIHHNMSVSL